MTLEDARAALLAQKSGHWHALASMPFDRPMADDLSIHYTDIEVQEGNVGSLKETQIRWLPPGPKPLYRKISKSDQH